MVVLVLAGACLTVSLDPTRIRYSLRRTKNARVVPVSYDGKALSLSGSRGESTLLTTFDVQGVEHFQSWILSSRCVLFITVAPLRNDHPDTS